VPFGRLILKSPPLSETFFSRFESSTLVVSLLF
jgi:hypothetical protein